MASAPTGASAQLHAASSVAAFLSAVSRLSESDRSLRRIWLASVDDGFRLKNDASRLGFEASYTRRSS